MASSMGLENIGKHIVGDAKWEKLYEGNPPAEEPQTDFKPEGKAESQGRSGRKASTPIKANFVEQEDDEEEEEGELGEENGNKSEDEVKERTPQSPQDCDNEESEAVDDKPEEEDRMEAIDDNGDAREENEMEGESPSSPNSPNQKASTNQEETMDSPAPSEGATGEEKGGALVDNLFQILPYWYFLNRAFGLEGEGQGQNQGQNLQSSNQSDNEQNEEDVEADEDEGSNGGNNDSPQNTSRLNSILLLESLRQQLHNQGTDIAIPNEHLLPQGLNLSEILSRMSSTGTAPPQSSWRNTPQSPSPPSTLDQVDDQPLDLTSSRKRDEPPPLSRGYRPDYPLQPELSPFILDEQTSKVFRSNPRSSKGYTAQELQAALHDIQSGKLGTRRAAVIYGIPRSTLRNKVYKLGKDRGRLFPAQNGPHNNNNNSNAINNNNVGKEVPLAGKLPYLQGLPYSQSRFQQGIGDGVKGGGFVRDPPTLYPVNGNEEKPGPPKLLRGKSSLSELISKHQQQRSLHQLHYQNQMELEEAGPGESEPLSLLSQADWKSHLLGQAHHQRGESSSSNRLLHHQQQEDPSSLEGKKSRPKRGKYRNYDREALVKAVRAVQNGEMSVHRAGSFFGVPHSTLEYKVKERHLLRRPKRKEVTSPVSQTKSSSPESSSDATSTRQLSSSSPSSSSFYSKGASKQSSSPYLFPLTSDLRESLSRYLNSSETQERSDSQSEMDVGSRQEESQPSPPPQSSRKQEFPLEGLIGSRLSSLFQLNDMLIRSSTGSETLDLSKK